jgi:hypothetical protein
MDCPPKASACPGGVENACSGVGVCASTTGTCMCFAGRDGTDCSDCAPNYVRVGTECIFLAGSLSSCTDRELNGNEEGVDCGGPHCPACPSGGPVTIEIWAPILAAIAVVVLAGAAYAVYRKRTRRGRRRLAHNMISPRDMFALEERAVQWTSN